MITFLREKFRGPADIWCRFRLAQMPEKLDARVAWCKNHYLDSELPPPIVKFVRWALTARLRDTRVGLAVMWSVIILGEIVTWLAAATMVLIVIIAAFGSLILQIFMGM